MVSCLSLKKLRRYFLSSFKKAAHFELKGVSEIKWLLRDAENTKNKMFTVYFYENTLSHRYYEISGLGYDLTYWPRLKEYHHMELWLRSGIKPDWYEDILQKKLMS